MEFLLQSRMLKQSNYPSEDTFILQVVTGQSEEIQLSDSPIALRGFPVYCYKLFLSECILLCGNAGFSGLKEIPIFA